MSLYRGTSIPEEFNCERRLDSTELILSGAVSAEEVSAAWNGVVL
jgi:hypothetical protein